MDLIYSCKQKRHQEASATLSASANGNISLLLATTFVNGIRDLVYGWCKYVCVACTWVPGEMFGIVFGCPDAGIRV